MIIKRKYFSRLDRVVKTSNKFLRENSQPKNVNLLERYADIVREGSKRAKIKIANKYKDDPITTRSKFAAINKTSKRAEGVISRQYWKGAPFSEKRKGKLLDSLKTDDNIDFRSGSEGVELFFKKKRKK